MKQEKFLVRIPKPDDENSFNEYKFSTIQEVSDFIDFLVMKHGGNNWELWLQFSESLDIVESDFSDYLANLEDYEERLANGEIKW
jgi:exopolysaccharide biosynthesis predicted pyruvyltransferase EpsI